MALVIIDWLADFSMCRPCYDTKAYHVILVVHKVALGLALF